MSDQSEVERECLPMCQLPLDHEGECDQSRFLERCKPSPGADHMQPVEVPLPTHTVHGHQCIYCRQHWADCCSDPICHSTPQPAPAPREISELSQLVRDLRDCLVMVFPEKDDGTLSDETIAETVAVLDRANTLFPLKSSRAPQTAPRDPYKRGQLLP